MVRLEADTRLRFDAWSRAAERVRQASTRSGLALDEEELALLDVRELHALHLAPREPRAHETLSGGWIDLSGRYDNDKIWAHRRYIHHAAARTGEVHS